MPDFVQVPPNSTGEKIAVTQLPDGGGNNVDRQEIVLSDPSTYAAKASVTNVEPGAVYGIAVRRVCVGDTPYHAISAATTNAASIKAALGRVTGWSIYNNAGGTRYVKFHDTAAVPTPGAGVMYTIGIQAGVQVDFSSDVGIVFLNGIGITMTANIADNDTTPVGLNDLAVNVNYK